MSNAAIYARISLDATGQAAGVTRQLEDTRALAARRGWTVIGEYVDNDVSAFSGKPRPEYRRLLADIEQGVVQVIVAYQPDRLVRRDQELIDLINLCEAHDVSIATVAGELDLSTPMGRMVAKILGNVSQAEVEQKGMRQRRANRQRAEAGRMPWTHRPYGYRRTSDGTVVVDQAEARVIRRMADQVLDGHTLGRIVRDLNDRGVPTVSGRPWSTTVVRRILRNPRYTGWSAHQGRPIAPAQWDAILDLDTQAALEAILSDEARKTAPKTRDAKYLLSGLAVCGLCGQRVQATPMGRKAGSRRTVYRCPALHLSRDLHLVDQTVGAWMVARLARPDTRDVLTPPSTPVAEIAAKVRDLTERSEQLARLYAAGDVSTVAWAAASKAIDERLTDAQSLLAKATVSSPVTAAGATLDGTIDTAAAIWAGLDTTTRRAILRLLVDQVTILPAGRGQPYRPDQVQIVPAGTMAPESVAS